MHQALSQLLATAVHRQFRSAVAALDDQMAGAAFLALESAALGGKQLFEFLSVQGDIVYSTVL